MQKIQMHGGLEKLKTGCWIGGHEEEKAERYLEPNQVNLNLHTVFKNGEWASEMAHWVKLPAASPDDWTSIPRPHMLEGEN